MTLLIDFNFDDANNLLKEIEELLSEDYFIFTDNKATILINAKHLIYEYYCLVHCTLDLTILSKNLGTSVDEAEKFVEKVLEKQNQKLQRVDNTIKIEKKYSSQYQQLVDKTKQLLKQQKVPSNNINPTIQQ